MMINIQVNEEMPSSVETHQILQAAEAALKVGSASPETELTIVLTGDAQLQELNRTYLGIDAPTDVLSFPSDFIDPDSHSRYLGDILISIPRAVFQAAEADHSPAEEMRLLAVHGVLHLLGYDHAEEAEKERMWALQSEILARLAAP